MNVILTNIDEPFKNEKIHSGDITVDELKIWPELERTLWRHRNLPVEELNQMWSRKIEIGNYKVVTFKVISEAFNKELNESSRLVLYDRETELTKTVESACTSSPTPNSPTSKSPMISRGN